MLILNGPDIHLTLKKPKNRIDNYVLAQQKKMDFIQSLYKELGCYCFLQPGDFFDTSKASDFLKQYWIELLKKWGMNTLTIFGQHDLRWHSSDILNTPLMVLDRSGVLKIVSNEPVQYGNIHIYGASWGKELPEIKDEDAVNILVIHRLVTDISLHWHDVDTTEQANILLRKTKFDLIVAGDNHKTVTSSYGERHLINCGSLMRKSIDQIDHEPCVFTYDTESKKVVKYLIPVDPIEKVMDMETAKEEKEKNDELEAFVDGLDKEVTNEGLIFPENLQEYVMQNELEEGVIDFIKEVTSCQIS